MPETAEHDTKKYFLGNVCQSKTNTAEKVRLGQLEETFCGVDPHMNEITIMFTLGLRYLE